MKPATTLALFGALARVCVAASCGRGLECTLTGELSFRSASESWGEIGLELNVSHNQDLATGALTISPLGSRSTLVPVSASLKFARGGREALLRWSGPAMRSTNASATSNYTALIIGLTPDSIWLYGSGGLMTELARAGADEPKAAPEPAMNASTALAPVGRDAVNPRALSMTIGSLHRFRSLDEPSQCLIASDGDAAPKFGSCTSEDALWEILKGRSDQTRMLRHEASGLCLVRQCYKSGTHPLKLGKCTDCGSHRWMVEGSYLTSQSVTSSKLYCVGRQPPSADANATAPSIVTTGCDSEAAERMVNEAARMTLSLPTASVDTLLDDWLAELAQATFQEITGLSNALEESIESDRSARLAMNRDAERYTAEVSQLKGERLQLRDDLAAEAAAREQVADSLKETEKQLKSAQLARKEAHESEKKWKMELAEQTEKGASLEQAAVAATAAMEAAAKRTGALNASIRTLNVSLIESQGRLEEKAKVTAEAEARSHTLEAEYKGLADRASEREAELAKYVKAATKCEARIKEEFKGQEACAASAKAAEEWKTKYESQKSKASAAEKQMEAARAAAVGKEEAESSALACATEKQKATDEVARLQAAQALDQAQLTSLSAAEQAALSKEGSAVETARLAQERSDSCAAELLSKSSRVGQLETTVVQLEQSNQSCIDELGLYHTHIGRLDELPSGPAVGHLARLGRALRALLTHDYETVRSHAARITNAVSGAAKAGHDHFNAYKRLYAKAPSPPALVEIPISARLPTYVCLLLLCALLRTQLQMRRMRLQAARDREAAMKTAASLEALMMLVKDDVALDKAIAAALDPKEKGKDANKGKVTASGSH